MVRRRKKQIDSSSKEVKDYSKVKEKIKEGSMSELLRDNFMPYSMSVIVSRAIPEIDGFKPSHRKVLYTMYKMGLLRGARSKSSNIAGQTLRLNPHSDASCYETMVRLTVDNDTLLTPFVDSKGNFGKHYSRDMAFSAPRYSEAKLMPIAAELFNDIPSNGTDMVPNYDGTMLEPKLLPVSFPNILANPNQGIAVGMASNICSFNLSELCKATCALIKNNKADITEIMPGPDFTTGGYYLMDAAAREEVYRTGKGKFLLRAKYTYDEKSRIIEITEIPFSTTIEEIIESVIAQIKSGKIKDINDIRDETDLQGLKIAIDVKRGTDVKKLIKLLYATTPLQTTFACNFNVLIDGSPKVLGVYDLIGEWVKWRRECLRRVFIFDLNRAEKELHLLEGLRSVLLNINKAIKIIRETEDDSKVIPNLMKAFKIDSVQAEYVAEIKLRNLNKDYILKKTGQIPELEAKIEELKKISESDKELDKEIIKQLKEIDKKYGIPRKTEIIDLKPSDTVVPTQVIEKYDVRLFITKDGYIKKVPESLIKEDSEIKVKDGDEILESYKTKNNDEVLFFTDKETVYKFPVYQLKDSKPSDIGEFVTNLIEKNSDENIIYTCPIHAKEAIMFAFENGKVARVPLKSYETVQNRKKLLKAYGNVSKLIGIFTANASDTFRIKSKEGRLVCFKADKVPLKTTKNTQGVQVIRLQKKDNIITEFTRGDKKDSLMAKIPATGKVK